MSTKKKAVWKDRPLDAIEALRVLSREVQERRLAHDMTQEELSARTGIHIRTIRRIESCARLPEERTIHLLARILQDDPGRWLELLRRAKYMVRKAGGLDAFGDDIVDGI